MAAELTLTQLSSNGSRVWLNRGELRWPLIGWFAVGAVPCAAAGGLLLAHDPLAPLSRLLGAFLIGVVLWRRWPSRPSRPPDPAFAAIGAASGLGSALLGSVGPLTAPFFLAAGLARAAYVGTEAASALVMHVTKIAACGAGELLTRQVLLYGIALTPATLLGAWTGKRIVGRISDRSSCPSWRPASSLRVCCSWPASERSVRREDTFPVVRHTGQLDRFLLCEIDGGTGCRDPQ